MHDNRQGLKQRSFCVADIIWQFVTPLCWMCLVPLYRAVIGIDTGELDVFAKVVAAILTKEAYTAGYARLYSNAIT